jgi:hypothetical protein
MEARSPMRAEALRRAAALAWFATLAAACSPASTSGAKVVTEWDCPSIDCTTLESSAACKVGVCVNEASSANVRVLVRLPTNTSVAPGMLLVASPSSDPECSGCVSKPTSYTTEQGILLAREAASALGFSVGAEVVVPARVTLEPLLEGSFTMNSVLPNALATTTLERWPRTGAGVAWRSPSGGVPETSRAVLFEGRYARAIEPEAPFDAVVPPVFDTLTLPGGDQMYGVAAAQLVTVSIDRLVLPLHDAGWSAFLVDAKGVRRSTRLRMKSHDGPVSLRIDAAQTPDPLLLDLMIEPNDASLVAPKLLVPAPTALRRIAYPSLAGTTRVNFRVLAADGTPLAGAHVSVTLRSLEPATGSDGELFAAYARAEEVFTVGPSGTLLVSVPYGSYDAFARVGVDAQLKGTRPLTYVFGTESATATFRPTAPRVLSGACAFVGGKPLAGASLEARSLDAPLLPRSLARTATTTDASGAFRLELPEGAFAFWVHPPAGAPMGDVYLGRDASASTRLSALDCRLRAPARRSLTILDGLPRQGAPVPSAIVETLRLRPGEAPLWLGEGISRPDGRVDTYEAP